LTLSRSFGIWITTGLIALFVTASSAVAAPKAPTNLTATPYNYVQISLSWVDASNNESGFRIERAASSSGPWSTTGTVGANVTSFASTGLTGSTTYYYRVFATSTGGDSPASNIAGATTPAPPVQTPAAPSTLRATTVSFLQINLTWVDNAANETGFKVERATASAGPWTQTGTAGANSTSFSVYGLNPSTTYYFRVRATNGSGDSAYSAVASATTPAAPPPSPTPPSNVTATAVSSSRINLAWTDTTAYEAGYVVERTSGQYWTQIASLPANYTSYADTGLTASTTYSYRVSSTSASGTLYYGPQVSATTQAAGPALPAAPSALTATAVSSSQINLTWADNSTNETGFHVERATSSAGPWTTIATTSSNVVAYSSTGLAGSTTYYFRVRAFNATGPSAYTAVVSRATPASVAVPAAPTALSATAISTSQINLTWTDNSANEQGFSIERGTTASGPWNVIGTTTASSFSDTGLAASTTYFYRVRAYNTAGNSAYTGTTNAATFVASGDTTDPTTPATIVTTSPTCGGIRVSWAASQDLGGSGLKGYNIYRKTATTPLTQVNTPSTSYVDTGLPSATYYYYTVAAVDNAGNESLKTTAVGTYTLSCAGSGGDHQWSKNAGGVIYPDDGLAIAMDSTGNAYVTGDFSGSTDFGLGAVNSAGSRDAYVAKYNASGSLLWAKRFGGAYDDFGEGIAVDASGNVFVTGKFQASADLGGGLTSAGGYDIFLAKLRGSDGAVLWAKRFGGTGADEGAALDLDSNGNVFITGQFFGTVDFGGGSVTNASSYVQAFVAKYSGADGAHFWSRRLGKLVATSPTTVASGRGISVDPSNNVVIAGYFGGPVDFGGGALTSAGAMDVFVAKYAGSDGHWLWAKRYGDANDQHANAVATDSSGNVIVTGDFLSAIDFGGGALAPSPGTQTIFLAKLAAADGGHLWADSFVAAGLNVGSYGWAVAIDGANNIIMTGQMSGPVDFGGGPLSSVGGVFSAKYGPTGVHLWSKDFRGGGGQGRGVDTGPGDKIVITGAFDSIQDFGGGDLRSAGNTGTDFFLLSLLP
jgi:fibronectin type 3 domain-containing protein